MFCSAMIVDADYNQSTGWEVVLRFGPDSLEGAWSDVKDIDLPTIVGPHIAAALIAERDDQ